MQVVDSAVLRFPGAVTHFSPGSYSSRPLQTTSYPNIFVAGDWVKGVPHGANGLSQVLNPPVPVHHCIVSFVAATVLLCSWGA